MFCDNCGAKADDDAVFCESCGELLSADDDRAIIVDGNSPELARRFSYEMDDYGPCTGPITENLLIRAMHYMQASENNFFSLTENATGRFVQTPGHHYVEASPSKGEVYGRNFDSLAEAGNVFLSFLLFGQFPDISDWQSVDF